MIDPECDAILAELEALGVRRRPPLRFLRRRHPINRWLGRVRQRMAAQPGEPELSGA